MLSYLDQAKLANGATFQAQVAQAAVAFAKAKISDANGKNKAKAILASAGLSGTQIAKIIAGSLNSMTPTDADLDAAIAASWPAIIA